MKDFGRNTTRVALLVDGDNVSPAHGAALLSLAMAAGEVVVRRVYGQDDKLRGWAEVEALNPRHSGFGKNGSDILLSIEAMELVIDSRADHFVIASSDQDFAHLATKLVERGFRVTGAGEEKTPARFRAACSGFHRLPVPEPAALTVPGMPKPARKPTEVEARTLKIVTDLVREHASDDGWIYLSNLATRYGKREPDRKSTIGANWAKWAEQHPKSVELHKDRQRVRLR